MSRKGLNKRERVLRALRKEEVDRRPFTFWHPYGLSHMTGDSLAAAALTFAATYGVDMVRMPVDWNLPLPQQTSLDRPQDLARIPVMGPHEGSWAARQTALATAVKLAEKRVAIFEAVPDPLSALGRLGAEGLIDAARKGTSGFLSKAMETVAASQFGYLKEALTTGGIDGVVLEIRSATYSELEPGEFESLVLPHLKTVLNGVRGASEAPIWIHTAGRRLYLEPLLELPHDLFSWPHLSSGPALEKLPRGYRGLIAGGLNETTLPTLSYQGVRHHVEEARDQKVAFFAPGDALPGDLDRARLEALGGFLQKRDRDPDEAAKAAKAKG